jgi:hypothetical protein
LKIGSTTMIDDSPTQNNYPEVWSLPCGLEILEITAIMRGWLSSNSENVKFFFFFFLAASAQFLEVLDRRGAAKQVNMVIVAYAEITATCILLRCHSPMHGGNAADQQSLQ